MNDRQAKERLDLIEQAVNDCKAGELTPLAALVAIGIIACPGEASDEQKEWAVDVLSNDNCCVCGNHITPEHGGIGCKNCGGVFCCDETCIDPKYLSEPIGYSQMIEHCHRCVEKKGDNHGL